MKSPVKRTKIVKVKPAKAKLGKAGQNKASPGWAKRVRAVPPKAKPAKITAPPTKPMEYNSMGEMCAMPETLTVSRVRRFVLAPGDWWFGDPHHLFSSPGEQKIVGNYIWHVICYMATDVHRLIRVTVADITMHMTAGRRGRDSEYEVHCDGSKSVMTACGAVAFVPFAAIKRLYMPYQGGLVYRSGVHFRTNERMVVTLVDGVWYVNGNVWCDIGTPNPTGASRTRAK